jgi:hypothetical protein
MVPGKRESRRVLGDVIQTQQMLSGGWKKMDDGVAIGGWNFDDHPPEGFDGADIPPFNPVKIEEPYNISFGALYSRNVANLMMAGRNISNSHVAFTSTRVMATCAAIGQAVGTAAAQCVREKTTPRELRLNPDRMRELRQALLRDDQTVRLVTNEDPRDLARKARASASRCAPGAAAEHVLTGVTRDADGAYSNRWVAPLATGDQDQPWLQLNWDSPVTLGIVQITFDTGFERELTLSPSDGVMRRIVRGPQPETVRDYALTGIDESGRQRELLRVKGNYQRLRRHRLEPVRLVALRLAVQATNGSPEARVYEIRCYEPSAQLREL